MAQYVKAFRSIMRKVYVVRTPEDADAAIEHYNSIVREFDGACWFLDLMLLCSPFLPLILEHLPVVLLNWFQLLLVAEKVLGLQPFGHLPWAVIIMPISLRILLFHFIESSK